MKKMKPIDLFRFLFLDLEDLNQISLSRDLATIEDRLAHEGLPFLMRTLPSFGDSFTESLELGTFQLPPSFKRRVALPVFLMGLTSRVFDDKTGLLLKEPCYVAVYSIRQICYLLYKYEVAFSDEMAEKAYQDVKVVDSELDGSVSVDPTDRVLMLAESIIMDIFRDVEWDILPKQGPGSTNRGPIKPWAKYSFRAVGDTVLQEFDESYFVANPHCFDVVELDSSSVFSVMSSVSTDTMREMRTSRMSAVPKNAKGPRIISAESPELMWLQLGVGAKIAEALERDPLSSGQINFHDQSVNAKLALHASETGAWATLDMSKASDRISLKLCRALLPVRMCRVLESIRSVETRFPDGSTIYLNKIAPMGNGFTFPLESLVFWSLAVASIALRRSNGVIVTDEGIAHVAREVFAYGDDLIIPVDFAEYVMRDLVRYGFVFNEEKSFWRGPFRESCGIDAFKGVDVTPLKIKKRIPSSRSDVDSLVGWLDMAKAWSGLLPRLSVAMESLCLSILRYPKYPEGYFGCIGVPVKFSEMPGKVVETGEIITRSKVKWTLPKGKEQGVVLQFPHQCAPSKGKMVRIMVNDALTYRPTASQFPEVHRYLRFLVGNQHSPAKEWGKVVPEATGDTHTFASRYQNTLKWKTVFIA